MSQPSPLSGYGSSTTKVTTPDTDHTLLFAQMIARTAKDIEVLIESLPSEESTAELQAAGLQHLEQESDVAGEQLKDTVAAGEKLLASIQAALHDISTKPSLCTCFNLVVSTLKEKAFSFGSSFVCNVF